ncbi:chemotaxis protein CheW [Fluviispira multicolorata]|uniref:Chemotaxis protein CheW n=1 Tax=Fluviispira multicolorata TaxID=2654512 RepID=A0A833JE62_9BACT|nr:chemotaxis protein CheW [Fluviispira multicolorata]KAB8029780.1 chemotaxis protein CheW [Fluviispira multicolorata]
MHEDISKNQEVLINNKSVNTKQFSAFYLDNRLYGIEVSRVQEVVRSMTMTPIPLAPDYVRGLINLRGQVATAIGLRELFGFHEQLPDEFINIVCKIDGMLISFQVDEIGDVIEVSEEDFEQTPQTISDNIRRYMIGVYKISNSLLSAIDVDNIIKFLNHKT